MEEDDETFAERVDVITQPDGAFIGRLEIGVVPGSHPQEEADALRRTFAELLIDCEEDRTLRAVLLPRR